MRPSGCPASGCSPPMLQEPAGAPLSPQCWKDARGEGEGTSHPRAQGSCGAARASPPSRTWLKGAKGSEEMLLRSLAAAGQGGQTRSHPLQGPCLQSQTREGFALWIKKKNKQNPLTFVLLTQTRRRQAPLWHTAHGGYLTTVLPFLLP